MPPAERIGFLEKLERVVLGKNTDMELCSITVNKVNVMDHIKADPNKLYNYMVKLLLSGMVQFYDRIRLFLDSRSVRVVSGHSLHDYLQTSLWFDFGSEAVLQTRFIG